MGSRSKRLRRGIAALVCVVFAAAAAAQAAAAGPQPEPAPRKQPSIRPEAPPSSSAAQATQKTGASYESSSNQSAGGSSTDTAPPSQTAKPAVTFPRTVARQHVRKAQPPVHRTPKKDPPFRPPTKRVESIASTGGEILATSARGLTKTPTSSESLLLLLVGLALVVLVVGETTFLRLAARGTEPRRTAEEQLPIHRVQLRR